jgi:hypothetical protein
VTAPAAATLSKNPVADYPSLSFVTGGTIGSTVPMRLGWCGIAATDARVLAYKVYQSTNGGVTFGSKAIVASSATSSTRALAFAKSYGWHVRITDSKGRTGGYGATTVDRLALTQDTSVAFAWGAGWRVSKVTGYSGGTERYATSTGATATITLTGARGFAVVASKGTGRGSFNVYVDGVRVGTVSQKASSTLYRRVLFAKSIAAGSSHVIVIRPAGNGRIDLDAIVALT